ncbi:UDP-N-acetylmuramate--L-alanine ligase [Desulfofalx alkaliphila]|uniref:UDP-N-acetylmuramate--L-alanine ligase n=1 Tax=Desulfofalx alkaliphila TaxID=105483 RepID=UPI0004E27157|nr:UDP-N-acetylmuramate--L-alanine ligase [Desulfofalx alkaliphila]
MKEIPRRVHFIGIGGAGMSGIARILAGLGYQVSGSDLNRTEVTRKLEAIGIKCFTGHNADNLTDAQLVVVSTAIPPHNPELLAAKERNIPIVHRAQMLAQLMMRQKGIAVAGAHGKTTTTSMLALVMERGSYRPTIVIGGELNDIGGNAKLGDGEYLVAEADESDGSFVLLNPYHAIITNIEDDHLDYYGNTERILDAFKQFLNNIHPEGVAVLYADDANIQRVAADYKGKIITYGFNGKADYTIKNMSLNGKANGGDVYRGEGFIGRLELGIPGQHNLLNALAVTAMAMHIGIDFDTVAQSLKDFRGAHRRYEVLGEVSGVKVVDDYAHHPTEVKATLKAARQAHPGRIIGVFQPHRYTRTKHLYQQFGKAFEDADIVVINNIYSAGEQPLEGVSAQLIVDAVKNNTGAEVIYIEDLGDVSEYLLNIARPGDIILTMGAGNIWTSGTELVKKLEERN